MNFRFDFCQAQRCFSSGHCVVHCPECAVYLQIRSPGEVCGVWMLKGNTHSPLYWKQNKLESVRIASRATEWGRARAEVSLHEVFEQVAVFKRRRFTTPSE